MDIELLRTFLEVNRTGHFGRAADNLYLTQSAVSARIKQLEEFLGVQLFERQRGNIRLTASGQRFMRHAETIVASWQRARQDVALEEGFSMSLAVAGLADLWQSLLLKWLSALRSNQPDIAFHAAALTSAVLNQQVINGLVDIGFVFEPQNLAEINIRFIRRMNLCMVSTREGLSLDEALRHDYIMIDWGTAYAVNHNRLFPQLVSPVLVSSHGGLALSYMLSNGGTAYLPQEWVVPHQAAGRLFPVAPAPVIEREVNAIWRADNAKSDIIRQLLGSFDAIV